MTLCMGLIRTPLDALYYGIHEVSPEKFEVSGWVRALADRLELMRDCAKVRQLKARESRLGCVRRGSKLREFKAGERVFTGYLD